MPHLEWDVEFDSSVPVYQEAGKRLRGMAGKVELRMLDHARANPKDAAHLTFRSGLVATSGPATSFTLRLDVGSEEWDSALSMIKHGVAPRVGGSVVESSVHFLKKGKNRWVVDLAEGHRAWIVEDWLLLFDLPTRIGVDSRRARKTQRKK